MNIWRWDANPAGAGTRTKFAGSTWFDDYPAFSPDGRRVAFSSNRTGANEIWVAHADGSEPRQVTFHQGPVVVLPQWSPDGTRLAYSSQSGGNRDIFLMPLDGSKGTRLTWEPSQENNPSWSRNGRWIYFRSDRGGIGQIWKVSSEGGAPVRVTSGEASQGFESPDGTLLYFVRSQDVPGVWSVPVAGGTETLVLPDVHEGFWSVADRGIAFIVSAPALSPGAPTLRFYTFASREVTILDKLPASPNSLQLGLSVTSDARSVLWTQLDRLQTDLMLINPWTP